MDNRMSTTENDIDKIVTAFLHDHGRPGVITGWIVLVSTSTIDQDGKEESGIGTIFAGGSMPWTQSLGLVEAARLRLHTQWSQGS